MEQPFQQTKAQLWDEVTETLCNLEFIQAKACAKMSYDLVIDFNAVLQVIPDNAENIREENERLARLDKYTQDLIACAKGEITRFELEVPESITSWPQERLKAEIDRMKNHPARLDCLNAFLNFLGQEAVNLQNHSLEISHFTVQQAWNYAAEGPVGKAADGLSPTARFLLRRSPPIRPPWNLLPQAVKKLSGHTD
jgi:hypothetical protein